MNTNELKEFLVKLGFKESSRNTLVKEYKIRDTEDSPSNKFDMVYKINKLNVKVIYKMSNKTTVMYKAKIKNLTIKDGQLIGLKQFKNKKGEN